MNDEDDRKRDIAWSAAWTELRIRHCLREAATVAHLRRRNALRDQFIIVAGQVFDEVADELEAISRIRPEWPRDAEFVTVTVTPDAGPTTKGGER